VRTDLLYLFVVSHVPENIINGNSDHEASRAASGVPVIFHFIDRRMRGGF